MPLSRTPARLLAVAPKALMAVLGLALFVPACAAEEGDAIDGDVADVSSAAERDPTIASFAQDNCALVNENKCAEVRDRWRLAAGGAALKGRPLAASMLLIYLNGTQSETAYYAYRPFPGVYAGEKAFWSSLFGTEAVTDLMDDLARRVAPQLVGKPLTSQWQRVAITLPKTVSFSLDRAANPGLLEAEYAMSFPCDATLGACQFGVPGSGDIAYALHNFKVKPTVFAAKVGNQAKLAFAYEISDTYDWEDRGKCHPDGQMYWLEHSCGLARSFPILGSTENEARVYPLTCTETTCTVGTPGRDLQRTDQPPR